MTCISSSQEALSRLLLFSKLGPDIQRKIVQEMHERAVVAGEILIKEGDTGLGASELFVVKSGKFEVSFFSGCRLEVLHTCNLWCMQFWPGVAAAAGAKCQSKHEGKERHFWGDLTYV